MKRLTLSILTIAITLTSFAQWQVTSLGLTNDTVTFDATFSGVNNGVFYGDGIVPSPIAGQLDSDGWKLTGMSSGTSVFGGTETTGDFARGDDNGGVTTGGLYAFEVASGDTALGIQPGGSDWTPGDLLLRVINNTGEDVDSIYVSYDLYVNNDQGRGNYFHLGWNVNDTSSYVNIPELNDTSAEISQGSVLWVASNKEASISTTIDDGDTLYLAWTGNDAIGGGSRDEFALDNIVVTFDTTGGGGSASQSFVYHDIPSITTVDANGVADSLNVMCATSGVVVGIDFDGNAGYDFMLWNQEGINLYSNFDVDGYTFNEGDSIYVEGEVTQNNGLIQFIPDSIGLLASNVSIPSPTNVTSLSELHESEVVIITNYWVSVVNGLEITLTDGTNSVLMMIDTDTDIPSNITFEVGDTLCYAIGIGSQNDASSPYDSDYLFYPPSAADIDNSCGSLPPPVIPFYPIPDINNVDANGEPDSLDVYCWTKGIALGIDYDGDDGLSFTVWDQEGINVYSFNQEISNYQVQEGDSLMIRGEIDGFRGLTEIIPDSIVLLNSNNTLPEPLLVTALDESTESALVRFENVSVIDTAQWPNGGSSNVDLVTCSGDTIVMRIDSDTDVESIYATPPSGYFNLIGIGGQFDFDAPFFDSYQIFPRSSADIDITAGADRIPEIIINEVLTENVASETDENGDHDDWIELKSTGDLSEPLAGLYLTNLSSNPTLYQIPMSSGESIAISGYKLIWADNESTEGDLHTNFTLNSAGDYLALHIQDGCELVLIDELTIPSLGEDESYGYFPENTNTLVTFPSNSTTPGMMNMLDTSTTSIGQFNIREELILFPNPVGEEQSVRFNQNISFKLYDVSGQLIIDAIKARSVNTADLPRGGYIIITEEGEVLKFIK